MTTTLKLLMCGAHKVGKSAILMSLYNDFDEGYLPTILPEMTLKDIVIKGSTVG